MPTEDEEILQLSNKIGYIFKDNSLLETALTHRSVGKDNNERLEFLGDAILGFVVADVLFQKYTDIPEGHLTRLRASLVRKETLAELGRKMQLGDFLKLGTGEMKSGGWRRDSTLANAVEAIIGAVYLDSDYDTCRTFVLTLYDNLLEDLSPEVLNKDPKTELQELLQANKQELPEYSIIAEEGAAHSRTFTVECRVNGLEQVVIAKGNSKRNAEQAAAKQALEQLRQEKM